MTREFDNRITVQKMDFQGNVRVLWRELVAPFVPLQIKNAQKHLHNCLLRGRRASILRAINIMMLADGHACHFLAAIYVLNNISHYRKKTKFETDLGNHLMYELAIPRSVLSLPSLLEYAITGNDIVLFRVLTRVHGDLGFKHLEYCMLHKQYNLVCLLIFNCQTLIWLERMHFLSDNSKHSNLSPHTLNELTCRC